MPPEALQLAFFLVEEAIKVSPGIYAEAQALFAKPNPTPQDWAALRARVLAKSYADYDPATIEATPVAITVLPQAASAATAANPPAPSPAAPPAPTVATAPLAVPASAPAELPITDTHTE